MRFSVENYYKDFEYETKEDMPDAIPLNIISGGCHLFGYMLKPGSAYERPHPCVVMYHGFPGYTTNNDLEYALMRMGCVVLHVNHRGAWGSEGNYLFSNLVKDAIAITSWAHNPAIAERYGIDVEHIFLVGHSMGGMTVLNAAKELDFIRGVAAIAPYDLHGIFTNHMEKELFFMIEEEGQCLKMESVSVVYEDAKQVHESLSILSAYEHLKDRDVLFLGAEFDDVAPPHVMIEPVYHRLKEAPGTGTASYICLKANHALSGQRTILARELGNWIQQKLK